MSINSGFNSLPRLVQIILLFIPGVNWITEILVRWSAVLNGKGGVLGVVVAVLVSIFGIVWGWVDIIWCLIFKHLTFA